MQGEQNNLKIVKLHFSQRKGFGVVYGDARPRGPLRLPLPSTELLAGTRAHHVLPLVFDRDCGALQTPGTAVGLVVIHSPVGEHLASGLPVPAAGPNVIARCVGEPRG